MTSSPKWSAKQAVGCVVVRGIFEKSSITTLQMLNGKFYDKRGEKEATRPGNQASQQLIMMVVDGSFVRGDMSGESGL